MSITTRYRVTRVKPADIDERLYKFLYESACWVNSVYGNKFDWDRSLILTIARNGYLAIAHRGEMPVGFLAGSFYHSTFDRKMKILRQDLLFALPKTRASYYLLRDFIDFGKSSANHIITAIGTKTDIKPRSLEKLGFTKLEELYRMEI